MPHQLPQAPLGEDTGPRGGVLPWSSQFHGSASWGGLCCRWKEGSLQSCLAVPVPASSSAPPLGRTGSSRRDRRAAQRSSPRNPSVPVPLRGDQPPGAGRGQPRPPLTPRRGGGFRPPHGRLLRAGPAAAAVIGGGVTERDRARRVASHRNGWRSLPQPGQR